MRIAVSVNGLGLASRFEQCSNLTIYTVEAGILVSCQTIPNPGAPYERLAASLASVDVRVLLVGHMGERALRAFGNAGIEVISVSGESALDAIERYLSGVLICREELCGDEA